MMSRLYCSFYAIVVMMALLSCQPEPVANLQWPEITQETKPWTRWWWHGSALTKEGITAELEAYQQAGLGGVEITPIYGVHGYEEKFVEYLSPQWMELLTHTLKEAKRLGLGVDMATGTGWPFGGPWIDDQHACKHINFHVYELNEGEQLKEKIVFNQAAYLSLVGNQVYEVHDSFGGQLDPAMGTRKEPALREVKKKITIEDIIDPVAKNKNLQALALNQVKFPKPLPLQLLMAYSNQGDVIDLTRQVDESGTLNWRAPAGRWTLYALFVGSHGKMVERAAPGGEGNVIDHFSAEALDHYLARFDSAFAGYDLSSLRSFFNDSYEVDDARGSADWTPTLFEEFKERRGYNLKTYLPYLLSKSDSDTARRVLCDYRQTISELLLHNFTTQWKNWAHKHSAIVRNQAHGSPANILDLYGVVDIPEIEGVEPLRTKMASSSAHVMGKRLVSAESATWLNEHFESTLADIKSIADRFLLHGVNHIVYHGTTYSPPDEAWPGWLFYASVHLNPRNPLWHDVDALNQYVARCQSMLQPSAPDHDILLYYPVYDVFSHRRNELIEHFDGIGEQFKNSAFAIAAEEMLEKGYTFDYISDQQIDHSGVQDGVIVTEGKRNYPVLLVPHCKYIPVRTFKKVIQMAHEGATIVFFKGIPESVAGFGNLRENLITLDSIKSVLGNRKTIDEGVEEIDLGKGKILFGRDLDQTLRYTDTRQEHMPDGLSFLRKRRGEQTLYFIVNNTDSARATEVTLNTSFTDAALYNPMTEKIGRARVEVSGDDHRVFVSLQPRESVFIETYSYTLQDVEAYPYYNEAGTPVTIGGPWSVTFLEGGPTLPASLTQDTLKYWTDLPDETYTNFSGRVSYRSTFAKPEGSASGWMLDLGQVKESAEVTLNGKMVGTLIGPVYTLYLDDSLFNEHNTIEIKVSNRMSNHIACLDRQNIFWKKFYNVNFPARKAENRVNNLFNASNWTPRPSGLSGTITLIPVK